MIDDISKIAPNPISSKRFRRFKTNAAPIRVGFSRRFGSPSQGDSAGALCLIESALFSYLFWIESEYGERVLLISIGFPVGWLASVVRGWLGYHAVPDNYTRLDQFVTMVTKLWLHQLRRRSQTGRAAWPWYRMQHLVGRYLPQPKILHPYPKDRFRARLANRSSSRHRSRSSWPCAMVPCD